MVIRTSYPCHYRTHFLQVGQHAAKLLLLSRFSRVWLCATPQTAAHQAPPSLGFSRQEHWGGLPFPSPMRESEKWKWCSSVVSDSSRPHELQPTRLFRPWDFPGKSTGVGCSRLLLVSMRSAKWGCGSHNIRIANLRERTEESWKFLRLYFRGLMRLTISNYIFLRNHIFFISFNWNIISQ